MPPFARSNLPGACHAAEGRRLIADGDGIGAIVRTLATAGEKHEERQGLKLALTTALIRLSIGEDHELRAKIIDAGALPLLIKLMDTSAGELSHNLQHCAAACLVRISDCAQSNLRTNLKSGPPARAASRVATRRVGRQSSKAGPCSVCRLAWNSAPSPSCSRSAAPLSVRAAVPAMPSGPRT